MKIRSRDMKIISPLGHVRHVPSCIVPVHMSRGVPA